MEGCGLTEKHLLPPCPPVPLALDTPRPSFHILQGGLILQHHPASSGKAQSAAPVSYLCRPGRCLELCLWGHTAAAAVSWSSTAGIHTHQNEEDSHLTSGLRLGHGVRSSLLSLTSSFPRLRAHPPWQACSNTFYSYCSCQMHLGRLP